MRVLWGKLAAPESLQRPSLEARHPVVVLLRKQALSTRNNGFISQDDRRPPSECVWGVCLCLCLCVSVCLCETAEERKVSYR